MKTLTQWIATNKGTVLVGGFFTLLAIAILAVLTWLGLLMWVTFTELQGAAPSMSQGTQQAYELAPSTNKDLSRSPECRWA